MHTSNSYKPSYSADFILYAQHGWADNKTAIARLAQSLASPKTQIITPDLGWWKTWFGIDPLIEQVENNVVNLIAKYPNTPIRIIGHSMGGLIWLEVLNRNPQWWIQIHSFVLIASPVGGAHLARMIDPLSWGIGIARDLGTNRRYLAERIAQAIPTLAIAGDLDRGSDGTITVESAKFAHSKFVCLSGVSHPNLRNYPKLVQIIRNFWTHPTLTTSPTPDFALNLVQRLQSVPGMTDADRCDFSRSYPHIIFKNGVTIRIWTNFFGIKHVYVTNNEGECLYSGFVGWTHTDALNQALAEIRQPNYAAEFPSLDR